jgi:hypothetical protein
MDNACVGATSWLRLFEFQGQVAVLWNEVVPPLAGFAAFRKEIPIALHALFSKI